MATRILQTVSETALQVRRCLRAGDEHEALRWVVQFVDKFEHASEADRPALVASEPPGTAKRVVPCSQETTFSGYSTSWLIDSSLKGCTATIPTPQCSSIAPDCLYESRLLVTYLP
jgi:hypothetical protein